MLEVVKITYSTNTLQTGRTWPEKLEDVRQEMKTNQAAVHLVTALDEVACELHVVGVVSGCGHLLSDIHRVVQPARF